MKPHFRLKYVDYQGHPAGKKAYNQALFTEVAPRYQLITRILSFGRDQIWKKLLVDGLPRRARPRCLDLACGTGDLTLMLAAKYPDGEINGLDLTPTMLEIARARPQSSGINWLQGDMCHTDFDDGSLDLVTGGYALRNAPDLAQALGEIHRVLKSGGQAAFLDFSKPDAPTGQKLHLALLYGWGGFWGLALHQRAEVYAYIAKSLRHYPCRSDLKALLANTGFTLVCSRPLLFGMMELTTFEKP